MVWNADTGAVVRPAEGHGHWVNTLALSSEYAVRTGPYDHKAEKPGDDETAKAKALERYKAATGGTSRASGSISGSDDFTWTSLRARRHRVLPNLDREWYHVMASSASIRYIEQVLH